MEIANYGSIITLLVLLYYNKDKYITVCINVCRLYLQMLYVVQ